MSEDSDFGVLEGDVKELSRRMLVVERSLEQNTLSTNRVEQNTGDLVEAWNAAKGAFKVLEMIGRIGKPLIVISGVLSSLGAWWYLKK